MGDLYNSNNKYHVKAAEAYEKAREIEGSTKILVNLQALYRSLQENKKLTKINDELVKTLDSDEEKAKLYHEQGVIGDDPEQAIENFQKAISLASYYPSYTLLVDLLCQVKNWEKAVETIEAWIQEERGKKELAPLYFKKACIYQEHLRQNDIALENLEQAISRDLQYFPAIQKMAELCYEQALWHKAESFSEQIIHRHSNEEISLVELYYKLGKIAENTDRRNIAVLRYQKGLEQEENQKTLLALGDIFYQNEQWEQALLIYMKLNSIKSEDLDTTEIQLRLAVIKDQIGMAEGAIEGYLSVLKENPQDLVVLESLGRIYFERQDYENALEYFQKSLEYVNTEQRTQKLYWITKIYKKLKQYSECVKTYEELIKLDKKNKGYIKELIHTYIHIQDWKKASQYIEKLSNLVKIEENQEQVEIHMLRGEVAWMGSQNVEEAIGYYHRALRVIPTHIPAIEKIANIHIKQENWEDVIKEYQNFIDDFPENARESLLPLLLQKAEILNKQLDDDKQATAIYERILDIAPDHIPAHTALAHIWQKDKNKHSQAISEHLYLLTQDPFALGSYHTLFKLYQEEKEFDRCYLCCQALKALDKLSSQEHEFLDKIPPRVASGWLDSWTIDNFIQKSERGTLYEIMAAVDPYTDKAYVPDLEKYPGLEREKTIYNAVFKMMKLMGLDNVQICTYEGSNIVAENTQPPTLIIGKNLWERLSDEQRSFVITKYLFYISRGQIMALKLSVEEYSEYVARLVEAFADTGEAKTEEQENISRRLRNSLPRKIRKQLEERMDILTELYQADTAFFTDTLEKAANNSGLLFSDSLRAATSAYSILRGDTHDLDGLRDDQNIRELFLFNISDEHFRLRREIGLEVKWLK